MSYAVLIIEDEETLARNILRYLERAGYEARVANDGKSGLRLFESFKPDVVLLDLRLPDLDGVEILKRIRATDETIKVLMMTAHGTVVNAVEAMKAGAHDYLTKPIVLSDLKRVLERTIGDEQVKGTLSYYLRRAGGTGGLGTLIGESKAIVAIKNKIHQLIEADRRLEAGPLAPVLITGETGTGKDLVAAAIHHEGPRGDSPFIEINCAGMPPTLVEGELFGHERGAFTDAKERKIGLFEAANGGTLFLNEVGELEIGVQAKLLKLLEDHKVRRLGGIREHAVDVRIIAATNQDLDAYIRDRAFRSDLYFRLNIANFHMPPLSQRDGDILLLAEHFLAELARRYHGEPRTLTADARRALVSHPWPGNVRELKNVMEQAVLFSGVSEIGADALAFSKVLTGVEEDDKTGPGAIRLPLGGLDLGAAEQELVLQALESENWNVSRAAKLLRLTRDTLRYRMEKFDLKRAAR